MKKRGLVAVIVVVFATSALAQRITIYKTFGNVVYQLNDSVELGSKQVSMMLFQNQAAYEQFKKARIRATISSAFGFVGAAMIAIPVATLGFGERADLGYFFSGVACGGFWYLFNRWFKARAVYAIDLYNEHLPQKTSRIKTEFQFYGTGAGLTIKF